MILNRQRHVPVSIEPLAEFFQRARCELHFPDEGVTVRLISDSAMAELNRVYRGKSGPTDVLSFPVNGLDIPGDVPGSDLADLREDRPRRNRLSRKPAARNPQPPAPVAPKRRSASAANPAASIAASPGAYIGDIAISPQTARRNARRASRNLTQELRILILHGMIHLAGYDHETDHGEMEKLERQLRRRLGLQS